jgi:hypothetical protein
MLELPSIPHQDLTPEGMARYSEEMREGAQNRYDRCKRVATEQRSMWLERMSSFQELSEDVLITAAWDIMNIQVRTLVTEGTNFRESAEEREEWVTVLTRDIFQIDQMLFRLRQSSLLTPRTRIEYLKGTLILALEETRINLRLIRRKVLEQA